MWLGFDPRPSVCSLFLCRLYHFGSPGKCIHLMREVRKTLEGTRWTRGRADGACRPKGVVLHSFKPKQCGVYIYWVCSVQIQFESYKLFVTLKSFVYNLISWSPLVQVLNRTFRKHEFWNWMPVFWRSELQADLTLLTATSHAVHV
jgi:hypothetical protein